MSEAIASHGTLLAFEATPGEAFTTIAELADIAPPPLQSPSTEVTPHNEDIDSYVIGVRRRGEMTVQLNFLHTETTHDEAATGLMGHWIAKTKTGYRLTFKDTGIWIFSGFVTNFVPVTPVREGAQTANVTFRPTGAMSIEAEDIS